MPGPDVELPADDAALEALLRARRHGPPAPYESTPWDFVRDWSAPVVRTRVWPIVSRMLADSDEHARARAVELVRVWDAGADLTAPRLLEVATTHPELYGDQAPEGTTLRHELAFALSNCARPENAAQVAVPGCARSARGILSLHARGPSALLRRIDNMSTFLLTTQGRSWFL
ncbi:MAG: hypothetical protein U0269_12175 [Polyangiales bacterium]